MYNYLQNVNTNVSNAKRNMPNVSNSIREICIFCFLYFLFFIASPPFSLESTLGNSQPLKILPFQSAPFFLYLHFSVDFLHIFFILSENFQIPIDKPASLCGRLNCQRAIKSALRLRISSFSITIEGGRTYDKDLAVPSGIHPFPA